MRKWGLFSLALLPGTLVLAGAVSAQSAPVPTQSSITEAWLAFASVAMMILGPVSLWFMRKMATDLKDAKDTIPQKVDPLTNKINLLETRITSLENDLLKRTHERDEARIQTDSYRQENRVLRDEIGKERLGREDMVRQSSEQGKRIAALEVERSADKKEIAELKKQVDSYKNVNELANTILSGMRDMLEVVKHATNEHPAVEPKPAS